MFKTGKLFDKNHNMIAVDTCVPMISVCRCDSSEYLCANDLSV